MKISTALWFLTHALARGGIGAVRGLLLRLLTMCQQQEDPRKRWTTGMFVWVSAARSVVAWGQDQLWRDPRLYSTVRWLIRMLASPAAAVFAWWHGLVRRAVLLRHCRAEIVWREGAGTLRARLRVSRGGSSR